MRFEDCKGAARQKKGAAPGPQFFDSDGQEARQLVELMSKVFDLRKLCVDPCPLTERHSALDRIHALASASGTSMPALSVLRLQLEILRARLVDASRTSDYKKRWMKLGEDGVIEKVRSGVHIMKDLFTRRELYEDIGDILYLFEQCVLKTCNESVLESMGNVVSNHASEARSLEVDSSEAEAYVHWNGPPLHLADQGALFPEISDRIRGR
eukprot:GHVU01154254.1.p1 GENE.GHVU01154254.1~~GHVU01154254.1.p1  ORF type:complete len:211 (+),score=29.79 GHVU01154254.1:683-1315(+)